MITSCIIAEFSGIRELLHRRKNPDRETSFLRFSRRAVEIEICLKIPLFPVFFLRFKRSHDLAAPLTRCTDQAERSRIAERITPERHAAAQGLGTFRFFIPVHHRMRAVAAGDPQPFFHFKHQCRIPGFRALAPEIKGERRRAVLQGVKQIFPAMDNPVAFQRTGKNLDRIFRFVF